MINSYNFLSEYGSRSTEVKGDDYVTKCNDKIMIIIPSGNSLSIDCWFCHMSKKTSPTGKTTIGLKASDWFKFHIRHDLLNFKHYLIAGKP